MKSLVPARPLPRGTLAFLVAWLGLLLAPCAPAAPVAPAGEPCAHMGGGGIPGGSGDMPCHGMSADGCAIPHDAGADTARPAPPTRATLLFVLPAAVTADPGLRATARPGDRAATGPPLAIRYCTLLN